MKKKFLYGLLCVSLSCVLVACGKKTDEGRQNDTMIEDSSSTKETEETGDVQDNASDNEVSTDLTEDTLGGKLYLNFLEQIQGNNDIESVATAISTEEITGYNCVVMPCEEGYLAGFDEEITGFDKAVSFAPMISTIPMVGYIFEVENPDEFKNLLEEKANPAWNICTQADEMVVEVYDNYVFFVMCPNADEN